MLKCCEFTRVIVNSKSWCEMFVLKLFGIQTCLSPKSYFSNEWFKFSSQLKKIDPKWGEKKGIPFITIMVSRQTLTIVYSNVGYYIIGIVRVISK